MPWFIEHLSLTDVLVMNFLISVRTHVNYVDIVNASRRKNFVLVHVDVILAKTPRFTKTPEMTPSRSVGIFIRPQLSL